MEQENYLLALVVALELQLEPINTYVVGLVPRVPPSSCKCEMCRYCVTKVTIVQKCLYIEIML